MNVVTINSLKLGNKTYADLTIEELSQYIIRNYNRVYVNTNDAEYTDLLQLEYDPDDCTIKLGRAKFVDGNTIKYVDVYIPSLCYDFCEGCSGGAPVDPPDEPDTPQEVTVTFRKNFNFEKDFTIVGQI